MDGRLGAPLCRRLIWASGRPPVLRIRRTTSPPTRFRQTPQPPSTTCAKHAPSSRGGHAPRPAAAHLLCQSAQPPRPGLLRPSSRASSRPSPHPAPGLKRLALWRSRVLRRARPPVAVFARAAKASGPERAEATRTMAG